VNALSTGYAPMPLPRMDFVARWPNGRIDTSDLLPHISLSFLEKSFQRN